MKVAMTSLVDRLLQRRPVDEGPTYIAVGQTAEYAAVTVKDKERHNAAGQLIEALQGLEQRGIGTNAMLF